MSNASHDPQGNLESEGLAQDPSGLVPEQDAAELAADARATPSATGTGSIKVTG